MRKRILAFGLLLVGLVCIVLAAIKIAAYQRDSKAAQSQFEEMVAVTRPAASAAPASADPTDSTQETESADPFPGPDIDMAALREQYPDLVGWLWADGLWSLPIMQGQDNYYWLYHLPDGSWSNGGCLMMDSATAPDLSSSSTVVYGHNMIDGGMLHDLPKFKDQEFLDAHPVMYFYAIDGSVYKCAPFAGYTTRYDDTPEAFLHTMDDWDAAITRSDFQGASKPEAGQPVLTLITCVSLDGDSRYVLHCTMTKCDASP